MILSKAVFDVIVEKFENHKGTYRELKDSLVAEFKVPEPVMSSLLSNEYKRRTKKNFHKMSNQGNKLLQRYINTRYLGKQSSTFIKMAEEMKISYTLLARMVTEKFFQEDSVLNSNKNKLRQYMKDTTLVEDEDLAYEIYQCIIYDEQFGHFAEIISQLIGQEYENHLQNIIKDKKLTFQCENDLRIRGYDKTPDVKLNIPFAVDGFIVNWIESKALFGSPKIHKSYIEKQYSSYWNRFGTGLVIYWKGMVDSIIDPKEKRFIVKCEFPENITLLNPLSLATIPKLLKNDEVEIGK